MVAKNASVWRDTGPVLWKEIHWKLLNSAAGSGNPEPPTGFGCRLISYTCTLLLISLHSCLQPQRQDSAFSNQKVKQLYCCTDAYSKLLFLHLQQDAKMKKKKQPLYQVVKSLPNFRSAFGYSVIWTRSILYLPSISLCLTSTFPALPAASPISLCPNFWKSEVRRYYPNTQWCNCSHHRVASHP